MTATISTEALKGHSWEKQPSVAIIDDLREARGPHTCRRMTAAREFPAT